MIAVKTHLFRASLFVTIFMVLGLALASCGIGGDKTEDAASPAATSRSVSLDLKFPEGYSYNRAGGELGVPAAQASRIAPYVTRITLTISGDGIAPITVDVPLDTLAVTVYLPRGFYTFTLTVYTNIGLTFTGSTTGEIGAVELPSISFDMDVNSPPTLDSLTVGSSSITTTGQTSLSASASDLDPDDVLTYQWSASGGSIAGSGNTATFSSGTGGTYTIGVLVSDGHGGTASGSAQVYVQAINRFPAISAVTLDAEEQYYTDLPVFRAWRGAGGFEPSVSWVLSGNTTWHRVGEFDPALSFYNQGDVYNSCNPLIGAGNYVPFDVSGLTNTIQLSCVAADPDGDHLSYALTATLLDATLTGSWPDYFVTSVSQTVIDPVDTSIVSAVNSFTGPVYVWDVSTFVGVWGWNTSTHVKLMDVTCAVSDGRGGTATHTSRYAVKTPGCA